MLREEFEQLTGLYPSTLTYHVIEEHYMDSDLNKQDFCKAYLQNKEGMASRIQQAVIYTEWKKEEEHEKQIKKLQKLLKEKEEKIAVLERKLDSELDWKLDELDSQMTQDEYETLSKCGKKMEGSEAIELIAESFGFAKHLIEIDVGVEQFETNRHHQTRLANTYLRPPIYLSTDYNYIAFICVGQKWEMVNGELYKR